MKLEPHKLHILPIYSSSRPGCTCLDVSQFSGMRVVCFARQLDQFGLTSDFGPSSRPSNQTTRYQCQNAKIWLSLNYASVVRRSFRVSIASEYQEMDIKLHAMTESLSDMTSSLMDRASADTCIPLWTPPRSDHPIPQAGDSRGTIECTNNNADILYN